MRGVVLVLIVSLAGCASPSPAPVASGWSEVPGLDHVAFRASGEACDRTCGFKAEVENRGGSTYGVYDDCADQWAHWDVRHASGAAVEIPRVTCSMCSAAKPFAPGARRELSWTWSGRDEGPNGEAAVPAGDYVATLTVRVDVKAGPHNLCEADFRDGAAELAFQLP